MDLYRGITTTDPFRWSIIDHLPQVDGWMSVVVAGDCSEEELQFHFSNQRIIANLPSAVITQSNRIIITIHVTCTDWSMYIDRCKIVIIHHNTMLLHLRHLPLF